MQKLMLFDLAEIRILDFLNIILSNFLTELRAYHTLEPGMWRTNLYTKIHLFFFETRMWV